jgi:ornithine cyclodeaminase/alanine dehydrogenase-like protein (mu-crystallin family)
MSGSILLLSAAEVAAALPTEAAIAAVRDAFVQLSAGRAQVPVRTPIPLGGDGAALFMPLRLPEQGRPRLRRRPWCWSRRGASA